MRGTVARRFRAAIYQDYSPRHSRRHFIDRTNGIIFTDNLRRTYQGLKQTHLARKKPTGPAFVLTPKMIYNRKRAEKKRLDRVKK